MTPSELKTRILAKLNIIASDFSDILTVLNIKKDDIAARISATGHGHFGTMGYIDLVASTTFREREYPLPINCLRLKAAFLSFDGSTWVRAKIRQLNDLRDLLMNESDITGKYSNTNPVIFLFRQSMWILSGTITAVEDGIQLWYDVMPDDVPDIDEATTDIATALDPTTTVQIGFPAAFHDLLCRGVCLDYKETNEIPLTAYEANYEAELDRKLKDIEPMNQDEIIETAVVDDTGENY
jgi:hypothetical protein